MQQTRGVAKLKDEENTESAAILATGSDHYLSFSRILLGAPLSSQRANNLTIGP